MKHCKQLFALLLAALMLLVPFTGCGKGASNASSTPTGGAAASVSTGTDSAQASAGSGDISSASSAQSSTDKSDATSMDATSSAASSASSETLDPNGSYSSKDDVALYIHTYGKLPSNFITKKDAQALGWSGGSLESYAPGKSIGGSRFGNYEGLLPAKSGRSYTECDIDTAGASSRGAKRIVFSNDGLIYYTDDHYETFTLLYGDEEG